MSMEDHSSNNGGDAADEARAADEHLEEASEQEEEEVASSSDDESESGNAAGVEDDGDHEDADEAHGGDAEVEGDDAESASLEPKKKRRRKKKEKAANMRRNIKSFMKEGDLGVSTKEAQAEEQERLRRIQAQQQRLQKELWEKIQQGRLQQQSHDNSRLSNLASQLPQHRLQQNQRLQQQLGQPPPMTIELSSSEDEGTNDVKAPIPMIPTAPEDGGSDSDIQILSGDERADGEGLGDGGKEDPSNSGAHVDDTLNCPDEEGRVLVNVGRPDGEGPVYVAPQLARVLKPHQVGGVRFLYDNVIESGEQFMNSQGFGCILAHSMGLGKTIQLCTFCDVFLNNTTGAHVLCIVPINTVQNWLAEFNHWLPAKENGSSLGKSGPVSPRSFNVFLLNDSVKNLEQRSRVIDSWRAEGGVLLMGYELYRLLANKKQRKKKTSKKKATARNPVCIDIEEEDRDKDMLDTIYAALVDPGPDLVICDEGHRIKNSHASISQALKSIRTRRRVVLTGYPLQNNLMEYWCMVDFVRPNFLGTSKEFSNLFERPIANGQCVDSTPRDKRVMMHRSHVLTGLLKGFVQRRSHSILQVSLPPKYEHVFLLRLMPVQRRLYRRFMSDLKESGSVGNPLKAFAVCCKIWNHPDVLHYFLKKREAAEDLDFLDVMDDELLTGTKRKAAKRGRAQQPPEFPDPRSQFPGFMNDGPGFNPFAASPSKKDEISYEWASQLMAEYVPGMLESSAKFQVLFAILDETIRAGERMLLFSQSLMTLNLVEEFLQNEMTLGDGVTPWINGSNYFRLDGSTPAMERERLINTFNNATAEEVPLFMVSTKAGCLGINLVGANRVVILDASWNPCHDSQAVCRVYRYGQSRPCHIYRLVTDNSVERRIYDRQVNKQGMADRVVDEQNPDNHLHTKDLNGVIVDDESDPIYTLEPETVSREARESYADDLVLQKVLEKCYRLFTKLPFAHESLLVDRKEKRLTRAEKRLAERSYQLERIGKAPSSQDASPMRGQPLPFFPPPPPLPRFSHDNGGEVDWGKHGGFFSGGSVVETAPIPPSTVPYPNNNGFSSAFAHSIYPPPPHPPPLAPMPGPSTQHGDPGLHLPPPPLTELERMLQTGPRQPDYEDSYGAPMVPSDASTSRNLEDPLQLTGNFEGAPPINLPPSQSFSFDGRAPQNLPSSFEQETGVSEASLAGMLGESAAAVQPSEALAQKGVSIRELRVPRDMEIATNSQHPPVRLNKGQRVMIIRTPKGVYLKLGAKVIKIRLPEELLKCSANNGSDEVVTLSGDEEENFVGAAHSSAQRPD